LGDLKDATDEFAFNSGTPKEFVERPQCLKGVVNAFALYAVGESMEPRFFPGELLFLNPNRPLTRHCFVAAELADGRGLVRQFVRRNEMEVVLRQFNPDKQVHMKLTDIRRLCRIVGVLEA
jgi:phage repressor protein C with HTH and peptisase S24 domain